MPFMRSESHMLVPCSSLGQNLATSTYVGEIIFAIIVATLGLVLFALLIGNMQVSHFNIFVNLLIDRNHLLRSW